VGDNHDNNDNHYNNDNQTGGNLMGRGGLGITLRRRWREAGTGVKAGVIVVVVALLAGVGVIVAGSSGSSGNHVSASGPTTTAPNALGAGGTSTTAAPGSTRGVTATQINVVFPVIDIAAIANAVGFAGGSDESYQEAIRTYVGQINNAGGINGRKINAEIVTYNPLDDADMRAKCLSWTKDQQVFAVVDAAAWHDEQQLCITQEGHTPLISSWTTVSDWTQRGAPNLWWTGPDQSVVLKSLVAWAQRRGELTPTTKFAIVAADRASDNLAVKNYLIPDLQAAGLTPADTETINFNPTDSTTANAQAPAVVQRLKAKGVTAIFPLLPVNSFLAYLEAADQQHYHPTLYVSDYENTISVGLGLAEGPFKAELDGMYGQTFQTLGNSDDDRGYRLLPQAEDCYQTWLHAHPTPYPDADDTRGEVVLESQGPILSECQNIRLFADAVKRAGPNLTRESFDAAMASITSFPGTLTPDLTFGPNRYAGPDKTRTVQIHVNTDHRCALTSAGKVQGSCWLIAEDFQ
jgi:ABC-type branched-subunit amino acid transport system substrate-binding protein